VHDSLDAEKVIYQVANLGREAIGCNRMVVWVDPQIKRHLRAISGVDKPDRRAVLLQSLEKLSKHCLRIKKPIVASRAQLVELPEEEELTHLLKHYFNVSQLDQIFLQPIQKDQKYLGVVIAEGFDEATGTNLAGLIASVSKHGALALSNALEMASVPWVRPLGRLQKVKKDPKKRRKWAIALAVILIGIIAGAFIPWTIQIDCNCKLTPRDRRIINAPLNGLEITRIYRHSGMVNEGEIIAQLDDTDFQEKMDSLRKLKAISNVELNNALSTSDKMRFSLEIERYESEMDLVQLKIEKCKLKAPIEGVILTPDLKYMETQTVKQGDVICELADLNHWELILEVPQEEIGWVQRALDDSPEAHATVEFFLQAYPEIRLNAVIERKGQIGHMAQVTEEGNIFEIRIMIPDTELTVHDILEGLRDGSIGAAKIATVQRPLGYVLVRKVIRFFRVTFF